jgi:hypothetical protein
MTKPLSSANNAAHASGNITDALTLTDRELFTTVLAKLRGLLADAKEKSKVDFGDGLMLHTPDVSGKYCGIWPDDFLYPAIAWYRTHKDAISQKGFTRQIAEKEGWQRIIGNTPVGNYTNGGFRLVGTGYVLPAQAHGDIELARMLVRDLAENIEKQHLPEYINAAGQGSGASGFLMAMPTVALECVLEGRPWPGYF